LFERVGLLIWVLLSAAAGFLLRPMTGALAFSTSVFATLVIDQFALRFGTLLPLFPIILISAATYLGCALLEYFQTYREQARTRRLFGLYLDHTVIDEMLSNNQEPELGGEKRIVTIWFSDVADFTSLSEKLQPSRLVEVMNRYFTEVSRLIEQHGGFVDKYIGDAVVGVFGAPLNDPYHAGHAVACALQAQKLLAQLNSQGAFGEIQLSTRIGLNTGEVLVGNIGSTDRFNYTVMGDEVNLASRLEGANKFFGSNILISESTAKLLPESIIVRPLGLLRVKGKTESILVGQPIDMRSWDKPVFMNPKLRVSSSASEVCYDDIETTKRMARHSKDLSNLKRAFEHWRNGELAEALVIYHEYKSDPVICRIIEYLKGIDTVNSGDFDPVIKLDAK